MHTSTQSITDVTHYDIQLLISVTAIMLALYVSSMVTFCGAIDGTDVLELAAASSFRAEDQSRQ